jgi:replication initiation protein RepC
MTKERADFRRLAQSTEVGAVTRAQLAVLAQNLPCVGLVSSTESHLLTKIINTATADAFDKGGRPIVFKSNRQLAFEIGKSEGRVSRLLSRLFDLGLITMQDSANFKRYPVRDQEGEISDACGIDLRILIARYADLDQLVKRRCVEKREQDAVGRRYRAALRSARYTLATAYDISADVLSRLALRVERIVSVVGVATKAPAWMLRRAARLLEWIGGRACQHAQPSDETQEVQKMTCVNAENDMHKQNTNPHPLDPGKDERSSANAEQHNSPRAGFASKTAFERSLLRPLSQSNDKSHPQPSLVALADVCRATPSLAEYGYQTPRSWADLARLAPLLCRIAGVSEDARQRAVDGMGQQAAAVAIAVTFEKYTRQEVSSPGGYLRAMTDRAASGELHLSRSVFGLAARNSVER